MGDIRFRMSPIFCRLGRMLFQLIVVYGSLTADELRADTGRQNQSVTNAVMHEPNGNGDFAKMHTNERTANIESGVRADMFKRNRMPEAVICGCGKRAARFGLWHNVDDILSGYGIRLRDNGTVQVLAALRRKMDAARKQNGLYALKQRLADLGSGKASDFVAGDFACAATDNDDLTVVKVCCFHQFFHGGGSFRGVLFKCAHEYVSFT